MEYSILGIDPGNNTGICVMTIGDDLKIKRILTLTLNLSKSIETGETNYYLKRKLVLRDTLVKLSYDFNIIAVGLENTFVNPKFPKSAITLMDYISCIELTFFDINSSIRFFKYPPKSVKMMIGAKGDATKEDMLHNLLTIKDLKNHLDTSSLTEHSVDATSIAYITLQEIIRDPYLLYAI